MKKGLTEMVFIIDRSGSMGGFESDTIGGFNSTISRQKEIDGEGIVTTVLFDDQYELLHDRFNLKDIGEMTKEEYCVRGCTALLDAMGKAIIKEINVQEKLPEGAKAEKVIFVIITDGYENASREFDYNIIKKLVEKQTEEGWEFMFLGANMDAVKEGSRFGIRRDRAVSYINDEIGIAKSYNCVSEAMCSMRVSDERIDESWMEEIEADYEERG